MSIFMYFKEAKKSKILLFFLWYSVFSFARREIPILTEIVTDNATSKIFTELEIASLKAKLTDFEIQTTNQIAVLTIDVLENETIESYALKVFNKNNLGQKNIDNGILILFSKFDKKVRIEVGYGLEPIITDALASRIIREIMIPNFKEKQYFKGIDEGSSKIMELINDPELIEEFLVSTKKNEPKIPVIARVLGSIFLTLFFSLGFNMVFENNDKVKKVNYLKFYKYNTANFYLLFFLVLLLVAVFVKYFFILFCISVFALFFYYFFFIIGFNKFTKKALEGLTYTFEEVFTGKLGVFIFPLYFILKIFFLTAGIVCMFVPLFFTTFFGASFLSINLKDLIDFKPIFLLYLLIGLLVIYVFLTIVIAIIKIYRKRESFGFSFFETGMEFTNFSSKGTSVSSSRSSYSRSTYTSSSSYSSSSSSSSDFSGGGGSSGGGGASGSW